MTEYGPDVDPDERIDAFHVSEDPVLMVEVFPNGVRVTGETDELLPDSVSVHLEDIHELMVALDRARVTGGY